MPESLAWLARAAVLPSPCFVIDIDKLRANAAILADVQAKSGARILLALKAYSAWATFGELSRAFQGPLWGTCASSVDEARLGQEEFGGEVHAFAAAWSEAEIQELTGIADHLVFNSLNQWHRFAPIIEASNRGSRRHNPVKCGLRLNPEHSEGAPAIYNPCAPGSRLGIRQREIVAARPDDLAGISGLHFHTLCEQNADALAATLNAVEARFGPYLHGLEWLNWGGGHHITREDYDLELLCRLLRDWREKHHCQIYLEPGEAIALDAGWLVATALDVVEADLPIVILDTSAACHMPDVLEMPYTPKAWRARRGVLERAEGPGVESWSCRLAGKSCLAGDVIGEYTFSSPLEAGDRLVFEDMAIYSMVKTTTFNGLRLPAIAAFDSLKAEPFRVLREFGYEDFKGRLS